MSGCLQNLSASTDNYNVRRRLRLAEQQLVYAAMELSKVCLWDVDSLDSWKLKRLVLREQLAWMLGLRPLPRRGPLKAETHGVIERPNYTIEKLVFQSHPGLYVTANFYLPKNRVGSVPCVIYLNGHWPSVYGAKTGFQDRYLWYPSHGFACLVIDPLEFGEVPGIHHGTSGLGLWQWLSLGYTPAGVEVWNAMRALDWLETRVEVEATRVGVTGISGGGVMSQYFAAMDDRVAVAAPSCSTYTIGNQAATGLVSQQCDCTFYPNVFGIDFPVVAALIAPRPLMLFGGRKDPIFPPAGFRQAFRHARRVYDLYGSAPDGSPLIRLVESPSGHTDPPSFLRECHRWMVKWLQPPAKSSSGSDVEWQPKPEPPETLACISVPPTSAANCHVHQTWIAAAGATRPTDVNAWTARSQILRSTVKEKVFSWFPAGDIEDPDPATEEQWRTCP